MYKRQDFIFIRSIFLLINKYLDKVKIFIPIILFWLSISSCEEKINCQIYHEGQFEIIDDSRDVLIERDKEYQIETDRSNGNFTKFRIVWLNPCTYRLFFLEGNEAIYDAWKNNFLEVMIIEGTDSEYSFSATFSKTGKTESGKVKKLNAI